MKWEECARSIEELGAYSRFDWPLSAGRLGFDCNLNALTINDLTGAFGWIATWPGDYFLSQPGAQTFFEMGPGTVVGSVWSYAIAVPAFVTLIFALGLVFELIDRVLKAIGQVVRGLLRLPGLIRRAPAAIWRDLRVIARMVLRALRLIPPQAPRVDRND